MKFTAITKAKNFATSKGSRAILVCKKHSPAILLGAGIAGAVGATVLACKETLKLDDIVGEAKDKIDQINAALENEDYKDKYSKEDAAHDKTIVYTKTTVKVVKNYLPSVGLMALSIVCILASYKIINKRNAALISAYNGIKLSFDQYRKRVAKKYGKDVERDLFFGVDDIKETVEKLSDEEKSDNKDGGTIKKASDVPFVSEYAKFFDEGSVCWDKSPEYNKAFLLHQQSIWNEKLNRKGHVFLNEVYDALGLPRTQAGAIVGWVKNGNGDGFIDFGITDPRRSTDSFNGWENVWLLDFNVDGVIYDKIGAMH